MGDELKKEVLALIKEDEEIIAEIKKIAGQKEEPDEQLNETIQQLERELKQRSQEIASLKEQLNENLAIRQKYEALESRYVSIDKIYGKYVNLGTEAFEKFEHILSSSAAADSVERFLAYGMQENNIVALWESIAVNYSFFESIGKLEDAADIFFFFLELYREVSFKPVQIDYPEVGMTFDERFHTRTSRSNVAGRILKVILPGFSIGRNIEKKAIVVVG